MTTYTISAGQYEGTLRSCGISLTDRDSIAEAVRACRAVCRLGSDPDGSLAVIVVRAVRS